MPSFRPRSPYRANQSGWRLKNSVVTDSATTGFKRRIFSASTARSSKLFRGMFSLAFGSKAPLFRQCILTGGAVTVTEEEGVFLEILHDILPTEFPGLDFVAPHANRQHFLDFPQVPVGGL